MQETFGVGAAVVQACFGEAIRPDCRVVVGVPGGMHSLVIFGLAFFFLLWVRRTAGSRATTTALRWGGAVAAAQLYSLNCEVSAPFRRQAGAARCGRRCPWLGPS